MRGNIPQLVVSDNKGRIRVQPYLEAAGMKGGHFFKVEPAELIKLPYGSRLFMLPGREPVGHDARAGDFVVSKGNFAVAAFISPGYTVTYHAAYKETKRPEGLPLFSYAAVCFYKNEFYAAAIRVDKRHCHDPKFINLNLVRKNAVKIKRQFPKNRLVKHLANCALVYGCPGAQNFFLGRYEGPLPTSPVCNAFCFGCISCGERQPRIKFFPSPEEIAETALFHIMRVKDPVVSFGQGCEGEPLLCGGIIEKSIVLIRKNTSKGIINMNTNASRPDILERLFDAGLDSMRVSLNSAREPYYQRYYKPRDYKFADVLKSIKTAKAKDKFVSVNYLTMPGFTDSLDEFKAFRKFICLYKIDMVQWRNLNFDPVKYYKILKIRPGRTNMLGVREIIAALGKKFPRLIMGYYNPGKI